LAEPLLAQVCTVLNLYQRKTCANSRRVF